MSDPLPRQGRGSTPTPPHTRACISWAAPGRAAAASLCHHGFLPPHKHLTGCTFTLCGWFLGPEGHQFRQFRFLQVHSPDPCWAISLLLSGSPAVSCRLPTRMGSNATLSPQYAGVQTRFTLLVRGLGGVHSSMQAEGFRGSEGAGGKPFQSLLGVLGS